MAPASDGAYLLKTKLSRAALREQIEQRHKSQIRGLSGGVFKAPKIVAMFERMLERFVATGMVDPALTFDVVLASSPEINGWVQKDPLIDDTKVYYVTIFKGLLDLVSDTPMARELLGPQMAAEIAANGEAVIAAVLAHELGHAMNGDFDHPSVSTRVFKEFNADSFAVELLARAGYAPHAAIDLLRCFEKMREGPQSISSRISLMQDEHPKPRFRISAIVDLVKTLQRTTVARADFGLPGHGPRALPPRPLPRDPVHERPSKQGVDGVKRRLGSAQYQAKTTRDKLRYLESYFASYNSPTDGMGRQSAVAIVEAYDAILKQATTLKDLDQIMVSFGLFLNNAHPLPSYKDKRPEGNVRAAVRRFRADAETLKLQLVETIVGAPLSLATFDAYTNHIDRRALIGLLLKTVRSAGSVQEVTDLLTLRADASLRLRDSGAGRAAFWDLDAALHRAAVERVITLTGDLAAGLDFLQGQVTIRKDHEEEGFSLEIPAQEDVFTGVVRCALERPEVDITKFVHRMTNPQTSADRTYAQIFRSIRHNVWAKVGKERGETANLNYESVGFTYGVGRSDNVFRPLDKDMVAFLTWAGGETAVAHYFNLYCDRAYTLPDAVELICSAVPARAAAWRAVAPQLLAGRNPRRGDDAHAQLRLLVRRLVDTGLVQDAGLATALRTKDAFHLKDLAQSQDPYLADIHAACTQSKTLRYRRMTDMLAAIRDTPEINDPHVAGEDLKVLVPLPALSPRNGPCVPQDRRIAHLDWLAKTEAVRTFSIYAPRVAEHRQVYVSGLDELVTEKRITPEVKAEFMEALDQLLARVRDIGRGNGAENDAETYLCRRRVRLMLDVLNHRSIGLEAKLTQRAARAINGIVDRGNDRPTIEDKARQLLTAFITADGEALSHYLENARDGNVDGISIDMARELAGRVAFYEGLGSVQDGARIFGFDAPTLFTRELTSDRSKSRDSKATFSDALILGPTNRALLAPFGPAFEDLVTGKTDAHRHGWEAADWYKAVLKDAWPYVLHRALAEGDPVDALGFSLAYIEPQGVTVEALNKFGFAMLIRALELVDNKADMDVFASLFALFIDGTRFGQVDATKFLNAEVKDFAKLGQLRYRKHFYDRLVDRLEEFQSWRGARAGVSATVHKRLAYIARAIADRAEKWRLPKDDAYTDYCDPILVCLWAVKKVTGLSLGDAPWISKIFSKVQARASNVYTRCLVNVGFDTGRISRERLFSAMQSNNVWSENVDQAICAYVRAGRFERSWTPAQAREHAVLMVRHVKALPLREQLYAEVLERHGDATPSPYTRAKNRIRRARAYWPAKSLWTKPVLDELRKTSGLLEAYKITERAWEDQVKARAAERGIDHKQAYQLLADLYEANILVECPPAAEVALVFPEGSAHRDGFLEKYVKGHKTTAELLKMFQSYKSQVTETPYHKIAKAFFEFMDDEAGRLSTEQRAEVALYLAGVTPTLCQTTLTRLDEIIRGNRKRSKLMSQTEVRLKPAEIRDFVAQAHPDEKLVAFRGLLLSGVIGDAKAEAILTEKLLFQDPKMPKYLVKLLQLFLRVIDADERSIYLSWLLANSQGKPLSGPEIVRFLVEKGGVVAAKVAQLVASYGFDLPPEYLAALEKFKGKAQKIEKIAFMEEAKKRLAPDKYDQIATFDEELGSGSFKIGYAATLKDGRRIVIMMPRKYVIERTSREFEITRRMLDEIMKDPELARDNYAPLRAEVERIVKSEMNFPSEERFMRAHKENHDNRPWLVRMLGNDVSVYVPQPLPGWSNDDILVEEYVDAKGFTALPARSLFGWSQEKLARAALSEVLNQMMAFARPDLLVDGKVTLDIDPHEENQLAGHRWFGGKQMINIDLGQSVTIDPEHVRGLVQMLAFIKVGKLDEAVAKADEYMDFGGADERETFRASLVAKRAGSSDPFEVLGQTLEDTGLKGVFLKPEYLYFQKLFATIVGLKRHIRDPSFIMKRAERIFGLHAIASPSTGMREVKGGWLELQRLAAARP